MKPHEKVAQSYLDTFFYGVVVKEDPSQPTEDSHLSWMLSQIINNEEYSATKKNRWLGYVQGVMVCKGFLDVSLERERTRPIFNGA